MQPLVRTKLTHDPASMEGQAYVPVCLYFEVETTGSGASTIFTAPPDCYVEKVVGWVQEAFDTSTEIDIGWTGSAGGFIANTEWTESTVDQIAVSSQTTAPDGKLFTAHTAVTVTVGGVPTTVGVLRLLFYVWYLTDMASQGFHGEITVP